MEEATARQWERTVKVPREGGAPEEATLPDQGERRAAYIADHWPEIIPEGNVVDDTLWSSFFTMGVTCTRAVVRVIWKESV